MEKKSKENPYQENRVKFASHIMNPRTSSTESSDSVMAPTGYVLPLTVSSPSQIPRGNGDKNSGSPAIAAKPKSSMKKSYDQEKLLQSRFDKENKETQFILIEGAPPQLCSSDVFDFVCEENECKINATWVNVICGDNEYCNGRVVCLFYDSKEARQAVPCLDKKLLMGSKVSAQLLSIPDMHRLNAAFPGKVEVQRGKELPTTTGNFSKKGCNIVLGNLPYSALKEEIRQHVEKTLEIPIDNDNIMMYSEKCNGTVQLAFDSEEGAMLACSKLQDSMFLNRAMRTCCVRLLSMN